MRRVNENGKPVEYSTHFVEREIQGTLKKLLKGRDLCPGTRKALKVMLRKSKRFCAWSENMNY